jgi:O-antigen/teichoic acid export membrane protein
MVDKVLTGARWATVLRLSAQVFSWLSTIIVVRFISPADYGLNTMLESPLILMMLFSTLGLDSALVQAKRLAHEELQSIFGWLLLINSILFLSYFFGGAALASYFHEPRLDLLAKALAFVFILVPFRVIPNALLDRQLDFKLRAQLEITATIIATAVTLVLAYLGAGVWALVTNIILSRLLLAVLLMVLKPWFIVPKFNLAFTMRLISVGWVITLSGAFSLLSDQLISFIAGPRMGASLLGIFAVGAQFASIPLAKSMPIINQTMLPAFSRLQEHRDSATYYLEKLLGVISLVFFPVLIGLACVADKLVPAILGAKWMPSILPLEIMSAGMILRLNTLLFKTAMTSMGRADLPLRSNFLQLAIMFPMLLYAVKYGVSGLVAAWLATEFMIAFVTIHLSKTVLNISFTRLLESYRPALVSSAIMTVCVVSVKILFSTQNNMIVFLAAVATGMISYYLAARLLFLNELQTALRTMFGNRLAFLAPQSN